MISNANSAAVQNKLFLLNPLSYRYIGYILTFWLPARDYHCKIKETLFIQELKPALNANVSSEKLLLY